MAKKRYFILSPSYDDTERMKTLREKASAYYGPKDYDEALTDPELYDKVRKATSDSEIQNASLLLIGITAMALAYSDSVFVANDWEEDDHCKFLHMLAFTHGIDIVYESV